jgi:glutathionyl-hydroquinone reductase
MTTSQHDSTANGGNTWTEDVNDQGEFVRQPTEFRNFVSRDPDADFPAEAGRYHLYVSHACPWAHRTLITRALKGLTSVIGVSVVHPLLDSRGWHFSEADSNEETKDDLYGASLLREFYDRSVASGKYQGRITVPILWDRKKETIVNNESAEIIRMYNSEFNEFAENPALDLYPEGLRDEIDEVNSWVYPCINNGVYRAGFAKTQTAYERAYYELFDALDKVEERLGRHRYLTGECLTEADIRLFTTLLRFDPVYHNHFRCNKKKLREFHNTWAFTLDIAQHPGVMDTIRLDHIKGHYYRSHRSLNPSGIVPVGPEMDLTRPHGRGSLSASAG